MPRSPRRGAAGWPRWTLCALVVPATLVLAVSRAAGAANPLAFSYSPPGDSLMQYAHATGMVVLQPEAATTSPGLIQQVRAGGGEVLLYLNLVDGTPDGVANSAVRADIYGAARGTNPSYLWTPVRYNYRNYPMLDIRVGSAFSNHAVEFVSRWVRSYGADGIFLDVLGTRLFSAAWGQMSAGERQAWTDGAYDLVSRIRAVVGDLPILVANNIWDAGQPALNGFCVEHHTASEIPFFASQLAWPGWHQPVRNLVIASDAGDAQAWRGVPGVTHVAIQTQYQTFGPPLWGFSPLPRPTLRAPLLPAPAAPALVLPPAPPPSPTPEQLRRLRRPGTPVPRFRFPRAVAQTFARGRIAPFAPLVDPAGGILRRRRGSRGGVLELTERPGRGGFAAIGARVAAGSTLSAGARLDLTRLRLRPGRGRVLMAVASAGRGSYQVGVVATLGRGLRWAAWITPAHGRRRLALGRRVPMGRWLDVRLRTEWAARGARGALTVNRAEALRTPPVDLRGARASVVGVGLGQASGRGQRGRLLVASASARSGA